MRKFLSIIRADVVVEFPPVPAPAPLPFSPLFSPSSSPTYTLDRDCYLFHPSNSIRDIAFDFITLSIIGCIVLLCFFSITVILYLSLKSRQWSHLRSFNSFWFTRILLVSFASLWAVGEALRLNIFRAQYFFPFLPSMSLDQQINLCKIHQVLSLGLFEPAFLVTLLLLVNVSIRHQFPPRMWALGTVFLACSPIFALQTLSVFFSPLNTRLPNIMHESSLHYTDHYGNTVVLCKYPVLSILVFGAFVGGYILAFLVSSWKVVSFVLNNNLRARINNLASTVMIALPLQILFLAFSILCSPVGITHRCAVLAMFLSVAFFIVTGDFILVITPITEAFVAGGHFCPWRPDFGSRRRRLGSWVLFCFVFSILTEKKTIWGGSWSLGKNLPGISGSIIFLQVWLRAIRSIELNCPLYCLPHGLRTYFSIVRYTTETINSPEKH